jgi:outer membrane protein OmpA-like peptidoglycan-associated protein
VERSAREEIENAELERTRVLEEVRESQAQVARAEADQATARADQLQQELADLQAEQTERGLVLTLGDVLFDTAEAQLKPGADATIRRLAEFLDVYPERRLLIEGHTDSRGSDTYNQDLSQRRADAVRTALMAAGVGEERVRALGLGEEYPVASNDTDAGRQENRRVEIIISTEGNDGFPATTTGASAQQY